MLSDLDREIRDHIERETEENIQRGLPPAEARRQALVRFGSVALVKEDARAVWTSLWLEQLLQDVRYAWRTFFRNRTFALVAVLTLALGIGITTSVFSVVSAVLLRPLPYPGADRLVSIVENVPAIESVRGVATRTSAMSQDEFLWWRTHTKTLHMAATMRESGTMMTPDGTVRLSGSRVSPAWFQMYGVQPALGRWLRPDEERLDARVIVLSTAMWRRYFGSDPNVLERTIVMGGRSYSVVGVMPAEFDGGSAFWIPFAVEPSQPGATTFVGVTSRLRDGVSFDAAAAEANVLGHQLRGLARAPGTAPRFDVVRIQDQAVARVRPALRMLTAAVAVVLLIGCANVANLLLARATTRQREIAVRRALGAARSRIVRQLLTESILLSVAGGVLGTAFAAGLVQLVKPLAIYGLPEQFRGALGPAVLDVGVFPRIGEVTIDFGVLAFVVGIALLTGLLFGLAPALRLSRVERLHAHAVPRSQGGASGTNRLRHALAISQLAMATTLLVVTGLLVYSFVKLSSVDIGFDSRVLAFELVVPQDYASVRQVALANEVSDRLRSLPAVAAAGFTDRPPLSRVDASWTGPVVPVDREWRGMDRADMALLRSVSPRYLSALGAELLAGTWVDDRPSGPPTILVNRAYARRFFGDRNPIGETLRWGTVGTYQVVGVVNDMHWSLPSSPDAEPHPAVFMAPRPATDRGDQQRGPSPSFAVRVHGDPLSVVPDLRRLVREVDPALAVDGITTMDRVRAGLHTRPRFYAVLLAIFGGIAGFIAAMGIYGVLAYGVTERTQEIGVRLALGARPADVLGLVLRQATALVAVGITLGLLGAVALTRYLTSMLFGLTPLDAPTYAVVAGAFAAVAMVASYLPARRATKVNPVVALRYE
jgi:putative ABC transport system permease protein